MYLSFIPRYQHSDHDIIEFAVDETRMTWAENLRTALEDV